MPPIFTAAQLAGVARPSPVGVTGSPAGGANPVTLTLSDGSAVQVCDTLETALKLMEYMRQRSQWQISASDDVLIVSVSSTKLLILEAGLVQQKLLASFSPVYVGGRTLFQHRQMSQLLSLDGALESVGFAKLSTTPYQGNADLALAPSPNILIVDWYYTSNPTALVPGSLLVDATPIVYDLVP
jgi:hypothetical protein